MARATKTTTKAKTTKTEAKQAEVAAPARRERLARDKATPAELAKLQQTYAQYRINLMRGTETDTAKARHMRREIARMQTYLNETKL